jgi:hypothetical protein
MPSRWYSIESEPGYSSPCLSTDGEAECFLDSPIDREGGHGNVSLAVGIDEDI